MMPADASALALVCWGRSLENDCPAPSAGTADGATDVVLELLGSGPAAKEDTTVADVTCDSDVVGEPKVEGAAAGVTICAEVCTTTELLVLGAAEGKAEKRLEEMTLLSERDVKTDEEDEDDDGSGVEVEVEEDESEVEVEVEVEDEVDVDLDDLEDLDDLDVLEDDDDASVLADERVHRFPLTVVVDSEGVAMRTGGQWAGLATT